MHGSDGAGGTKQGCDDIRRLQPPELLAAAVIRFIMVIKILYILNK